MEPNDEAMQDKELVVTFNSHFQSNHKQLNTRMCTHTTSVVVKGKISNDTILLSGHPQSTLGYSLVGLL